MNLLQPYVKVSQGERYVSHSLSEMVMNNILDEKEDHLSDKLSVRELEVISLMASGMTISNIAQELSLSPKTVSTYRTRILSKLELKTTSDIIKFAINEGFANEIL